MKQKSDGAELLTVIIPVRNRMGLLRETLRSVSGQQGVKPGKVRMIVVDNGSTDGAREMVEQWIEREAPAWLPVEMLHEKKPGACAARNRGVAVAHGEWVIFFDSDDVMEADHIRSVVDAIETMGEDADVICWDVAFRRADGKRGIYRSMMGGDVWLNVVMRGTLSTQRYCCRRDAVIGAGGWDEDVEVWNDWELSVRLIGNGARLACRKGVPTVTVIEHDNSITGKCFSDKAGKREMAMERARCYAQRRGMERVVRLIEMKGAVLAGDYAREGERDLPKRLIDELAGHGVVPLWKLRIIAGVERMLGRGASVMVKIV
ncbi:MAG: glycosyltransferase family 2 protein [Muribaculaceae bacterium]|nr:glycosyltransferase family 2 protein [Muribaculaceae bacterium]